MTQLHHLARLDRQCSDPLGIDLRQQRLDAIGDRNAVLVELYALGRDGYFSLNLLSSSDRIADEKSAAHELLADLSYNAGKRYEDFSATTDRIAAYGLAALIGGVAIKKLGLLALAGAFILKFAKVILIGVAAVGALVMKLFRRKPPSSSADRTA
jgi:uncharacterized membrane-anchored protein